MRPAEPTIRNRCPAALSRQAALYAQIVARWRTRIRQAAAAWAFWLMAVIRATKSST